MILHVQQYTTVHVHVRTCVYKYIDYSTNKIRRYPLVFNLLEYFLSNELIQICGGLKVVPICN